MAIRGDIWVDWDANPRVVWIKSPSTELLIQDLVDTLRDLEADPINMGYTYIVDAAGKDVLGTGIQVGITATLNNAVIAFEDRLGPAFVRCTVKDGNLVANDENGDPMEPVKVTSYTQVKVIASAAATIVTTDGGSGSTDWTATERNQIRYRLGIDGSVATPSAAPSLVADTADAVWESLSADHLTAGTLGLIVNQIKSDTGLISIDVTTILDIVTTLQKYNTNRTKIDKVAKTLTVYDNNGITPIKVFDLKDSTGTPSITEITERTPQ